MFLAIAVGTLTFSTSWAADRPEKQRGHKPHSPLEKGTITDVGAEKATHEEVQPLDVKIGRLTALRLRPDGSLLVGDAEAKQITVVGPGGKQVGAFALEFGPEAVNVAADGTIYCGGQGQLARLDRDGRVLTQVSIKDKMDTPPAEKRRAKSRPQRVSGIATGERDVFVAVGSGWSMGAKAKLYRFNRELKEPVLLAEGLRGCCQRCDLVAGDALSVNPGAKKASLAALDRRTGKRLWSTPGGPPGYAAFILAELGGRKQIIGYDAISLGGWDTQTGRRLWRLVPQFDGDFNVPTPIALGGRLLVATENNGARLYGFDSQGCIRPKSLAHNEDAVPDTSTPVVLDNLVFVNCGRLSCLDLDDGLKELWQCDDRNALCGYCSFIAGNGRVLVTSQSGKLLLLKADRTAYRCVASLDLFNDLPDSDREV